MSALVFMVIAFQLDRDEFETQGIFTKQEDAEDYMRAHSCDPGFGEGTWVIDGPVPMESVKRFLFDSYVGPLAKVLAPLFERLSEEGRW